MGLLDKIWSIIQGNVSVRETKTAAPREDGCGGIPMDSVWTEKNGEKVLKSDYSCINQITGDERIYTVFQNKTGEILPDSGYQDEKKTKS